MAFCDLHTHSYFSDGSFSPEELLLEADRIALSAIALCDHNTVAGLPAFLEAAKRFSVQAIPGVELSSDYLHDGKLSELHILALFLPRSAYDTVTEMVEGMKRRKEESNRILVKRLRAAGYDIDYREICRMSEGLPNRAHIAKALFDKGYVVSVREAFATLLAKDGGFYTEPRRLDVFSVLDFIHSAGAVSVLAHPFLNLGETELRAFLPEAKAHGLLAMETLYPLYDEATSRLAASLAEEYRLAPSGGSDFHGENKPDLALGKGRGNLAVPSEFARNLQSLAKSKA